MKIVIKDTPLKQIYSIQKHYLVYIVTYHFYLKGKKLAKQKNYCGIEDVKEYIIHISALKQALNHSLKLKNVHRVIRFNQQAWLKPYIDMNTSLRKQGNNEFEKNFFKLMNNSVFLKDNRECQKAQRY